jgi:1,2-diacylglycerol 3-alpha-glucosyltransferase
MKLAIFTDLFLPHVDGITNSLVHLIKEYVSLGHDILVVTPKTKGSDKVELEGVKIIYLPSLPSGLYPEFMFGFLSSKLLLDLRRFSPDVVHVTSPGPVGSMGLFYARLSGIKSVATFHGYFMEPEYLKIIGIKKRGVALAQRILWKFTKTFYDRADRVITPSKFVKQDLEKHNFARPITVINNAVDFSHLEKNQKLHQEFIEKYNLKNKSIILFIGRISVEKNIGFLINSFAKVVKNISHAHLLIVGDGPDQSRLQSLVKDLGISKHVTFTGEIKNEELAKIDVFGLAKVFATSSDSEVQPISIIEAMKFGLPIVAVKSRGLTEMIKNNGLLIESGNSDKYAQALEKILSNAKLQKAYSQKSFELAQNYSTENSATQHLKLYTDLIKNLDDSQFISRVLKSRIIRAFRDLIFLAGLIHLTVLFYLFFTQDKLEYINIFYILDLEKIFPYYANHASAFLITGVIFFGVYLYFFQKHKR